MSEAKLRHMPRTFQTVEEVLGCVSKLNLNNILVLSEREDGTFVLLDKGLTFAQANWLIDKVKHHMLNGDMS